MPIIDGETDFPDSIVVGFASSDPFTPGVPKVGSWLDIDSVGFEYFWGTNIVGNGLVVQATVPAVATAWALKIDVNGTPGYIPVYSDLSWES